MEAPSVLLSCDLNCTGDIDNVAWCAESNLIAVACRTTDCLVQPVCILEPDCPQDNVIVEVPLVNEDDYVAFLDWSPVKCPRALLTVTHFGACYVWLQTSNNNKKDESVAVNKWHGQKVANAGKVLVCAKWLSAPSCWVWPPQINAKTGNFDYPPDSQSRNTIDGRFFDSKNIIEGVLPWLRPGMLCVAIISEDAEYAVFWRTLMGRSASPWVHMAPVSVGSILGPIISADVTGSKGNTVRIVAVSKIAPTKISVLEAKGDPTWCHGAGAVDQPVEVSQVVELDGRFGTHIEEVSFDKCTGGMRVLSVGRNPTTQASILTQHVQLNVQDDDIWEASGSHSLPSPVSHSHFPVGHIATSPDGTLLTLFSHTNAPAILSMRDLAVQDVLEVGRSVSEYEGTGGTVLHGAFGPTGSAFALGINSGGAHSRIVVWSIPEYRTDMTIVNSAVLYANRIAWGFVTKRHLWDTIQQLHVQDAAAHNPDTFTSLVLGELDKMLHAHPHHPRPHYAELLDHVKSRILGRSTKKNHKAVLIDIYARSTMLFLNNVWNVCLGHEEDPNGQEGAHTKNQAGEAARLLPWVEWLHRFRLFFCQCLKTWIGRCRAVEPEFGFSESPSNIPFVRLLIDSYFMRRLQTLILILTRVKAIEPHVPTGYHKDFQVFHEVLRQVDRCVNKSSALRTDVAQKEDRAAAQAAVQSVLQAVPGDVHLHYSRPNGVLKWQNFSNIENHPLLIGLPELLDSEIETKAAELCLLPVSPPPPYNTPLTELSRGYNEFRIQTPSRSSGGLFNLKRKKWELDRDVAIGKGPSHLPPIQYHRCDCLSASMMPLNQVPTHQSVDGSSMTSQLNTPVLGDGPCADMQGLLKRAYTSASPVTASRWKRVRI